MFNVGFTELIVLGVIGLLVLGPEQLPVVARKLARILNDLKRAKDDILSPVEDLKAEARQMLERAREVARQNELEEMVRKSIEPEVPPHPHPSETSAAVESHEHPTPEPVLPPTIGTPKKDV